AVLVGDQQALPLLGPVVLVVAVVVVAALRPADLEEVRVVEHRRRGGVAAAGMAPDADPVDVAPRMARRELLQRGDPVGRVAGGRDSAAAVALPPADGPQMPTRWMSIRGWRAASCFSAVTWSGRVLSAMSPALASWKALLRHGWLPMPSIA